MRIEHCKHLSCRRAFEFSEYGLQMPGTKEPEDITCPHYGYTYTETCNGYFLTHTLSSTDGAKFNEKNPF